MRTTRRYYPGFFCVMLLFVFTYSHADNNNMTFFPIEDYSQNVDQWLDPSQNNYHVNLLNQDYQQKRLRELTHTYFGTDSGEKSQDNSLWSEAYVIAILNHNKNLPDAIHMTLNQFDNVQQPDKTLVYGVNYRPYSHQWIQSIQKNIDFSSFEHLHYLVENRAIATENLSLRIIPTDDPGYYSTHIAGEGYPFDNIQASAVYVGTPLYILGTSIDKAWTLVMTPECLGWIKSNGVARVNSAFITRWQTTAYKHLIGVKVPNVSVLDAKGNYRFSAYVGMIFPMNRRYQETTEILIPMQKANGWASIENGFISSNNAVVLPWTATQAHFAELFKSLEGRGYGWGNLGFYNDCSAEMKAIFTLFGIFMPRNTQSQGLAAHLVDISHFPPEKRADYLMKNGVPLLTLVHVKGHILLYIGSYKDKQDREFPLSYQQVWSLSPKDKSSRAVIGQAVFLPLLTTYPEDPHLAPQLDNDIFQLIYLNEWPSMPLKQMLTL